MVRSRSPSARAAVTNSISLRVRTEPRTTRANCGTRKMALATITLARPVPRAAMMARARKMPGKAIMMSTSRMITMSGQRPTYPAHTPNAVPTRRARPTAAIWIWSEIRAPYRTRESTSRPSSSVPSQCSALGPCSRSTTRPRRGSYGASRGASTASSTKRPTITPPLMAARLFTIRRRASLQKPGERLRVTRTSSAVADAGVEVGIGDVGEEIDEHEGRGDDQERTLHDGIVAREDAFDDQAADSRQREDRLGEDGAAEVVAEFEAEDGEDRDHGVAEGVAVDDELVRDALGARRPHVVLAQHLEHRGARSASDHGGRGRPQDKGGHDEMPERTRAAGRQPVQPHREDEDGQQPQPENRQGDAHERAQERRNVERRIAVGGGDNARDNAECGRDEDGQEGQLEGEGEALLEQRRHRLARLDRHAEISYDRMPKVGEELHGQGSVEPILLSDPRQDLFRRFLAGQDQRGITGDELEERERHQAHPGQNRDEEEEAPDDVGQHAGLASPRCPRPTSPSSSSR